jgi:patatin-related protein
MSTAEHTVPQDRGAATPRDDRELRIALAMRGGVSLAVWMGGACREVARLREQAQRLSSRAPAAAPTGIYELLLERYGYDGVSVDVLAGTSAGGLNGALMAAHLVYGMPFDHNIRDIWLQVGHLELLTRSPGEKAPPSLLLGDAEFYTKVQKKLTDLIEAAPARDISHTTHPVRLILTATRLTPRTDMVRPQLGPLLPVGQSRSHFRFRHRADLFEPRQPGSALSDFGDFGEGGTLTPALRWTIDCLAYAARTTSSFPGAFEPARPFVETPGIPHVNETTQLPVDFRGVSSETGAPDDNLDGQVELIDGGVLDNIPISWAVRAIAAAPSDRPVDRWLLYLQPVPPLRPDRTKASEPGARRVTRLVKLIRRTQSIKTDTESLLDDAEEMRRAVADAHRRAAVAAHALPTGDGASLIARADQELDSYRLLAGRAEAERIIRLFEDPIGVVGPDPLPLPDTQYPLRELDAVPETQEFIAALRDDDVVSELARGPLHAPTTADCVSTFRSPLAVARTAGLLLDWVRAIEREHPAGAAAGRAELCAGWRTRIYAARFAAEVLVAARDRVLLRLASEARATDPTAMARKAMARLASLVDQTPMPTGTTSAEWDRWTEGFAHKVVNALGSGAPSVGTWTDDCDWHECSFDSLWCFLGATAIDISQAQLRVNGFDAFKEMTSREDAIDRLAAAEVLIGPLRADALSGTSLIGFATVSAANESPLEPLIFEGAIDDANRVTRKLSGNQVANFASFLSARWRATDWTWGRLDAARSLVEAIARPDRTPEGHSADALREMFVTPMPGPHAEAWHDVLVKRWNDRQDRPDTATNADNLAQRTIDVMTERLQWEILAEEIPVVKALQGRPKGSDRPPDRADLPPVLGEHEYPPPPHDDLQLLGHIGSESVVSLVHKKDLRRSLLRIGLVAWRALQPSGSGLGAKSIRVGTGLTIKPLLWLPALFTITAPLAGIFAALLTWFAVAVASDHVATLPSQPIVLIGVLASSWVGAWQLRTALPKPNDPAMGGEQREFPAWPYVLAFLWTAALIAGTVLLLIWDVTMPWEPSGRWARVAVVTALLALAVIMMLVGVLGFSTRFFIVLILGVIGCFGAACFAVLVGWDLDGRWDWQGLLLIAAPLLVISPALTWCFPKAPQPAE